MQQESARILSDLVAGNDEAAREIFDRYTGRLVALAKTRLSEKLRRRVDPEDIVQSVYRSFFRKAENEEIILKRNGDLWRLLAAMTVNKTLGRVEYELAQKRHPHDEESGSVVLGVVEREPTPDQAAILIEELTTFMESLSERDRKVFQERLQGAGIESLAEQMQLSEAGIRRILRNAKAELERRMLSD